MNPTRPESQLVATLKRIDRRPYPAYRDLKGLWAVGDLTLTVDHVQGDPFASPSRLRIWVQTELNADIIDRPNARAAAEDWLLRQFVERLTSTKRGSGKSGQIRVYQPGPEITERSAVRLHSDGRVELRFQAGLPAQGRKILGRQAIALLTEDIPYAAQALQHTEGLQEQVQSVLRQRALREALPEQGLVAFIGNGSILPRTSGIHQTPLEDAIPFQSPKGWEVTLNTPFGSVTGCGFPKGVTLIVGGGFHGKSTVLQAIQRGHLDHIPGDGRELVVADSSTVKIRAEDGRRIARVNISPFLNNLPGGKPTESFETEDASGSTSQAAAIMEALESGAKSLLLDEDTSATNLLVRDEQMKSLIPNDCEPITPLIERIQQIHHELGVSTIMVIGGVGDYFSIANRVLAMENYRAKDVTEQAKALATAPPKPPEPWPTIQPRRPLQSGLEPQKIRARNERRIGYGGGEIDLSAVEQILDVAHAATLGEALRFLHESLINERRSIAQILDALEAILNDEGVEALAPRNYPPGDLIRPRRHEVAAALNRHRRLKIATGRS